MTGLYSDDLTLCVIEYAVVVDAENCSGAFIKKKHFKLWSHLLQHADVEIKMCILTNACCYNLEFARFLRSRIDFVDVPLCLNFYDSEYKRKYIPIQASRTLEILEVPRDNQGVFIYFHPFWHLLEDKKLKNFEYVLTEFAKDDIIQIRRFGFTWKKIFYYIFCDSGDQPLLVLFLIHTLKYSRKQVAKLFDQACSYGRVQIVQHLQKVYQFTKKEMDLLGRPCLRTAAGPGHLAIVRELCTFWDYTPSEIFSQQGPFAWAKGFPKVQEFLKTKYVSVTNSLPK